MVPAVIREEISLKFKELRSLATAQYERIEAIISDKRSLMMVRMKRIEWLSEYIFRDSTRYIDRRIQPEATILCKQEHPGDISKMGKGNNTCPMLLYDVIRDIHIITVVVLRNHNDFRTIRIAPDAVYAHPDKLRSRLLSLPPHYPDIPMIRHLRTKRLILIPIDQV